LGKLSKVKLLLLAQHFDRPEANLALQLRQQGVELVARCERDSPYQEVLREAAQDFNYMRFPSRISPSAIFKLRQLLRKHKIDLVHSLSSRALSNALMASVGLRTKHVAYRGTIGHLDRLDPSSWLSYLHPRLDRIICVSGAVRTYLLSLGMPATRPVVIYKGHNLSWYQPAARSALGQFGIPESALVIGCCANMRAVKGVDILIEAAAQALQQSNAHLLLLGEVRDPRVKALAKQFPDPSKIHLAGFRSDAAALLGACDIAVVPSREREGLPKAAIEAMAQAVPVIVSDVGGLPELVQDQKCGLVVPAGDVQALCAALVELSEDAALRTRLGQAAQARIAADFSLEQTLHQTLALYRELIPSA
jgi:glycosyltransferase involved in cell wall biosynthesis